ncbi:MAG: CRISPR-associated helicase/endonuclease Cas3 [Candidatus Thiodiazotropha sp. (ex Lucinoma kastoroae)]|nr:CRISPR-associated helicase/endonuclease Cas3 [Candidatus Thiodiazotropha sp. (ex Lucinoma kastoroae)]
MGVLKDANGDGALMVRNNFPLYYHYWGKTAEDDRYHLLPYHCLDVAAVGDLWWRRDPIIRRLFTGAMRQDEAACLAWVLFFLALHDLGKIDVRFQLKAPKVLFQIRPELDGESALPDDKYYHGPSGWEWFALDSTALGIKESDLVRWRQWMQAVCGHHGSLTLAELFSRPLAEDRVIELDKAARLMLVQEMADFFLAPQGLTLASLPPPAPDLLAGFCSVCDWVGSNQQHFSPVSTLYSLSYYWKNIALERAGEALDDSGVSKKALSAGGMIKLYPNHVPRQVQTLMDLLPLTPGLTLIEAPTGSGKTEAALAYASRLLAAGLADSVIFALPTQATANAMFSRLEEIALTLFPGGSNILLAHGRRDYNPKFQALKTGLRHTAQGREEAAAECVAWLSASRKRAFLGQIGVCTIDQVFLSVLPVRHQFVRAFGVRKSILIIDEVHAYDTYMYGLLETVISGQKLAGSSAVLLSATLPAWQKVLMLGEDDQAMQGAQTPYPQITYVPHQGEMQNYVPDDEHQPAPFGVAIECWRCNDLLPDESRISDIVAAARQGALVGIVCNLVADAQQLATRLRAEVESMGEWVAIDLFHARFRFKDRQTKEQSVMERYGKDAGRKQGRILVATQVIEQSLDLDFDWLITQLCPVDLLFQRIGRLHRHSREARPVSFATPKCTVLLPDGDDYQLHKVIYGHRQVLWRTQQLLEQNSQISFPAAYRDWIERVYDPQPWQEEPSDISQEAEQYRQDAEGRFYGAKVVSITQGLPLPDTEGAAGRLTRDGEMSLSVVPLRASEACVLLDGENLKKIDEGDRDEIIDMNTIGVPAGWGKWLPDFDDKGVIWVEMMGHDGALWAANIGKHRLVYTADTGLIHEESE